MHSRHTLLLCLALWLGLNCPSTTRADDPANWVANSPGSFVTALCRDTRGCMWIGAKDQGLWRLDESMPQGHQISHYLTQDGLGDNTVSALACDKAGHIWAGTKSHGVSVFNGNQWQNFDQVTGPLRSHVVALACSPVDGSIWGATEAGLFRYAGAHWTYLTHAEGLPSDQATCLAFSKDGTLYVGTASDGIVIGSLRTHYRTWRHVYGYVKPLDQGRGYGLPSGLINCLLVGANGTIYCGTNTGLGWSVDKGVHWVYNRGQEWVDKGAGADKSGLVGDAMLCGLELAPLHPESEMPGIAVAAGKAVGGFLASQGFESGTLTTDYGTLDPATSPTLAPKELYRSQRWGTFTWTGSNLSPNAPYRVRLHFAEFWATQPGQRVFNVFANGSPALTHLDIFRAAGGQNRALAYDFTAKADGLGRLTLAFQGSSSSTQGLHPAANLLEDYITCLAEEPGGKLWIGHRGSGMEAIDEHSGARVWPGPGEGQLTNQVTAILPSIHGIWLGTTDSGLRLQLLPVVPSAMTSNFNWSANSQGQSLSNPQFTAKERADIAILPPPQPAEVALFALLEKKNGKPLPLPPHPSETGYLAAWYFTRETQNSNPAALYALMTEDLHIAALLLSEPQLDRRRLGLVIARYSGLTARVYLQDYKVDALICEAFLIPHLDIAYPQNGHTVSRCQILEDTYNAYAGTGDSPHQTATLLFLLRYADSDNTKNWARMMLAQSYEQAGNFGQAIAFLKTTNPVDTPWLARLQQEQARKIAASQPAISQPATSKGLHP